MHLRVKGHRLSMLLGLALTLVPAGETEAGPQVQEAQKAASLAKRPLSDADIEQYCAVRADIEKLGKPKNTPADLKQYALQCKKVRASHGVSDAEYNVLLGRIMTAQSLLRLEKQMTIPADKKADVEIVRKNLEEIRAAEGKAK